MDQHKGATALRKYTQNKRQETIVRVIQAIVQLQKDGTIVNFQSVSDLANVSRSWLYKEPEIRYRIQQLRGYGIVCDTKSNLLSSTSVPRTTVMKSLKERIVKKVKNKMEDIKNKSNIPMQTDSQVYLIYKNGTKPLDAFGSKRKLIGIYRSLDKAMNSKVVRHEFGFEFEGIIPNWSDKKPYWFCQVPNREYYLSIEPGTINDIE